MIHLDTNFLIGVASRHLPVEHALKRFLQRGEDFATSAIAWAEFLNGPVNPHHVRQMNALIHGRIIPFGRVEAEKASQLFNLTGRGHGSIPDCFIAATAISNQAALATQNQKHFAPFVSAGLSLA